MWRAVLAVCFLAACTVDRKTEQFACGEGDGCPSGRRCVDGYCITGAIDGGVDDTTSCPAPCDACDLGARTCQIVCDSANACGNVVCPAGFTCEIDCLSNSACDVVTCDRAAGCTITCSGNRACGPIACGTGPCEIACTTTNSCDVIQCNDACRCDVACSGDNCGILACPSPDGVTCTTSGVPGSPCSSAPAGCNTCP